MSLRCPTLVSAPLRETNGPLHFGDCASAEEQWGTRQVLRNSVPSAGEPTEEHRGKGSGAQGDWVLCELHAALAEQVTGLVGIVRPDHQQPAWRVVREPRQERRQLRIRGQLLSNIRILDL